MIREQTLNCFIYGRNYSLPCCVQMGRNYRRESGATRRAENRSSVRTGVVVFVIMWTNRRITAVALSEKAAVMLQRDFFTYIHEWIHGITPRMPQTVTKRRGRRDGDVGSALIIGVF